MTYFNTTHEPVQVLKESRRKAAKQEELVLAFFKSNPNKAYTPPEIMEAMRMRGKVCPLTSWRRAITNLEQSGELIKVGQRNGMYGKRNYTWTIRLPPVNTQQSLF